MKFSSVILAAGESRRMGCDKAFIDFNGRTLLTHQIETAFSAGADEVLVSGRPDAGYGSLKVPMLYDDVPGCGPISGLITALKRATHDHVLLLAVDLVNMKPSFLRALFSLCTATRGVVPKWDSSYEPLAAFYPAKLLPLAEAARHAGDYSLQRLISTAIRSDLILPEPLPRDARFYFHNLNTPDDFNFRSPG